MPAAGEISASPTMQKRAGGGADDKRKKKPWLPWDQQHLSRLKAQGRSTEQIAETLGQTPSAITQQWRKQR